MHNFSFLVANVLAVERAPPSGLSASTPLTFSGAIALGNKRNRIYELQPTPYFRNNNHD
ncbi:hypothetical protein F7734_37435 [Scytonema sp. UIC 10036]|uniref:hypothetical protein n=1 Tax=Scytonema sp. UIC 10036 TaxID=2304196 RepID=UPI0012DAAB35|nr:hypothetical protein [Scytonema sp. UIC 10036]MUG97691.1 hypothetical protein [Scytonema sp. UIC 10036]